MQLILGLLLAPVLLYVPGLVWGRFGYRSSDWLDRQFERMTVSALWTGWWGLVLASLGWFSLLHLVLGTALFCGLGWWLSHKFGLAPLEATEARPAWERWLFIIGLLIFAAIVARPFETVLGGRDAGVYTVTGFAIERTGSIVQDEALVAEIVRAMNYSDRNLSEPAKQAYSNLLGKQDPERFLSTRFHQPSFFMTEESAAAGKSYPNNFHLYPTWIAIWTSLFGLYGGLLATGYLGWLGAWSVAMVGRRVVQGKASAWMGILALGLLSLNSLQIWFSRYSTAEAGAQWTVWGGLAMWAAYSQIAPAQRSTRRSLWYATLCGLAIGQLALMRLEFYFGVFPIVLYLAAALIRRRWRMGETAMLLGFGLMMVHAAIHISTIGWLYFMNNTWGKFQDFAIISRLVHPFYPPLLQDIRGNNSKAWILESNSRLALELGIVLLGLFALWALWRFPRLLNSLEAQAQRWQRWLLGGMAVGLVLLAGYAYFIRPQHLSSAAILHPIEHASTWNSYIGGILPIPEIKPRQTAIAYGNMVRLGWYFSPLGIGLGIAGLALWIWRDMNRSSWLILLLGILYGAFSVNDSYGTADQTYIYIARRFIPGAVPMLTLGMAWLLAKGLIQSRWFWRAASGGAATAMLLFFVATGWRTIAHVEYQGALAALTELANQTEPNAIVLMRGGDRDSSTNIATPMHYLFDRDYLVAYSDDPTPYRDLLAQQVRNWQAQGRPVYVMLGSRGGMLNLPGFRYENIELFDLPLKEWQQLQLQKPFTAGDIRFTYRIYRLVADSTPMTGQQIIAIDDYRWQHSGINPVETNPKTNQRYAWTAGNANWIMPAVATSSNLSFSVGLGLVPPSLVNQPVELCLSASYLIKQPISQPLGCQQLSSSEPTVLTWQLPALPEHDWLLQLSLSRTWTPNDYAAEYPSPPNDARSLGIQWSGIVWQIDQ